MQRIARIKLCTGPMGADARGNVGWLQKIRKRHDPHRIMCLIGRFKVLRAEMSTVRCESFSSDVALMGCERMILSCFASFIFPTLLCNLCGGVLLELTCSSLRFRIDAVLFTRSGGDCTGALTRKDDQLMWLIAWPIRIFARACRR
jgi:hypothetical protein